MTDLDQLPSETSAPPPPASPRRRRRWGWVVLAVVLGAATGSGLATWDVHRHHDTAATSPTTTLAGGDPQVPAGLIGGVRTATPPATHTIDNRVFVVGDSVMQGAAPYLAPDLPGWSIIADTKVGRFLDQANVVITKRTKDIGRIAVLNLGNNYDGNQVEFAQQVNTALTELTGVEHVIWINVAEFQDDRTEVNSTLTQAAATHPNLTIVDWNSWWTANRDFTGADHLHLTDDGARAYASLVAAAVRQVTAAAGEIPAPGATKPSLNTSGTIPGSRSSGTGSSRTRTRTTVRHPATTAAAGASAPTATAGTPTATTPAPVDTTPKSTSPTASTPTG